MTVDSAPSGQPQKRMRLRYAGTCRLCSTVLATRTEAIYERATKTVRCLDCMTFDQQEVNEASTAAVVAGGPAIEVSLQADAGVAGSSARREYERRKARDDARLREKWGRLGGIAAALAGEKQSTTAWQRGAVGEEHVGARLDGLAPEGIAVLHDRRIAGTRANIDHLAITRSGVWVVDAKRYRGRPTLKIEGGMLRPRVEKVIVDGRDRTKLIDGVLKQIDLVRDVVGDIPVTGALCFVEADWPLFGGDFITREIHVLWPRRLAKLLHADKDGPLDVDLIYETLASTFAPA